MNNLLRNPNFTEGFYQWNNVNELTIPTWWDFWYAEKDIAKLPSQVEDWHRPEMVVWNRDDAPPDERDLFFLEGGFCLKGFKGWGVIWFSLFQEVTGLIVGQQYHFTVPVFPDLVAHYDSDGKVWAPDPLSGEVRLMVSDLNGNVEMGDGWMNGNVVRYYVPEGVKILSLKYRETGYNCEFTGHFSCNDPFMDRLWEKAVRTLYVTMRDTYMDCPDRERSQWWGDLVNESGEAFYALSPEANDLTKKGMVELIKWQRRDSTIFAPIPAGNWGRELPGQMLASVGYYGFWNYFMNTGDAATLESTYQGVKTYLHKWELNPDGTLKFRTGEWPWGDWGSDKDTEFLYNAWYSLALKGFRNMAELFDIQADVAWARERMDRIKAAVNEQYWKGDHYRSANYKDDIDDRSQAMAVLAGYAGPVKYPVLFNLLKEKEHASPYMEKYVIEALFVMGYPEYGLVRLKKRFARMVDHPYYTTLWEGWEIGSSTYGGGTFNHAWSGGGLTILSQYVAGIYPLKPGFELFEVRPRPGGLTEVHTGNETIAGRIEVSVRQKGNKFELQVEVPEGTQCLVCIPEQYRNIKGDGQLIFDGRSKGTGFQYKGVEDGYHSFLAPEGKHLFSAK